MSREPSGVASSPAPAAVAAASSSAPASSSAAAERVQSDEVPDHGVKRGRWSPPFDASEMNPGEVEHSQARQPESATEDLEDAGDQGDADDGDEYNWSSLRGTCDNDRGWR